jgi:MFS family permease
MAAVFHKGVSLIAWATGIRWIGWAFVEPIIPLFFYSFTESYAYAGVLHSAYYIVFLLSLPIVGELADRMQAKTVILIGLLAYPFIGLSYFLAGFFGIALFVVIARALNGFGYAFDNVGRATYYMRAVKEGRMSEAFGHFDAVSTTVYVSALFLALLVIPLFGFEWLALFIIPFSIVAIILLFFWLPKQKTKTSIHPYHYAFTKTAFTEMINEVRGWGLGLRLVGLFVFFQGFTKSVARFILPIFAFATGSSLLQVIFMAVLFEVPKLFGDLLGRAADKRRVAALMFGITLSCFFFVVLAFSQEYVFLLVTILGIGFVSELVGLSEKGLKARLTRPSHFGKMNSVMNALMTIGGFTSPLALGFMLDFSTATITFLTIALFGLILLVLIGKYQNEFEKVPAHAYQQKRHLS